MNDWWDCRVQGNMKLSFETADALKAVLIPAKKLLLCLCAAEGVLFSSGQTVVKKSNPGRWVAPGWSARSCSRRGMDTVWSDRHLISEARKCHSAV